MDVGFTHTRFAVAEFGELLSYRRTLTTVDSGLSRSNGAERREDWLARLAVEIERERVADPLIECIGLSFPGVVAIDGVIWRENAIWGYTCDDLPVSVLTHRFGLPVMVANDLAAAAIRYGFDSSILAKRFLLTVSVGSGIGAKLFDRRSHTVLMEENGRDGEIGLAMIDPSPNARPNALGLKGILGNYSSGYSYPRRLREKAKASPKFYQSSLLGKTLGDAIHSSDRHSINLVALQCLNAGDRYCLEMLAKTTEPLARILQTLILFCAPEAIVITGGFADQIGDPYLVLLREQVVGYLPMLYPKEEVERMIRPGRRDDCDSVIGLAAWLTSPQSKVTFHSP